MTQLFISNHILNWDRIEINNINIIKKIKNVLRAGSWYKFYLQDYFVSWDDFTLTRYLVEVESLEKSNLIWLVKDKESFNINYSNTWILVPLLNSFDKIELIVQKLSELWIENIVFWKSRYSQINTINDKKIERFNKIALEAVQQSKWYYVPKIFYTNSLSDFIKDKKIISFNFNWENYKRLNLPKSNLFWIIWPEWWLSQEDLKIIDWSIENTISLWNNILRAETAAIIWWRIIINA